MEVNLVQYRAAIGIFNRYKIPTFKFVFCLHIIFKLLVLVLALAALLMLQILLSNDIQLNPGPVHKPLLVGHLNARSLRSDPKFDEISSLILEHKFDLFAISETWLDSHSIRDLNSISIHGCHPFVYKNRPVGRGGGVGLFVSETFSITRRSDLEFDNLELLWVELRLKRYHIFCGACYRPPNNSQESLVDFFDLFQHSLDKLRDCLTPNSIVIILGDLNAHFCYSNPLESTIVGVRLHRFLQFNNLCQIIREPTRVTATTSSIIDLIITNVPDYFIYTSTLSPPYNCDHSVVLGKMRIPIYKAKAFSRTIWDFRNINSDALNLALINSLNDEIIFSDNYDIDQIYSVWFRRFMSVVEMYIPHRNVTIRPREKPWMTSVVRKALRKRDRLLKSHNRLKLLSSWEKYRIQRNYTTAVIRKAKSIYYKKINISLADPKISSKKWWSIAKHFYSDKASSIPTITENQVPVSDSLEKANLFNEYFASQMFVDDSNAVLPPMSYLQSFKTLSVIVTSENELNDLINLLDVAKACGYDGVSNRIIKICSNGILKSFTRLINRSFSFGQFPHQWKFANVFPLFKKNSRELKVNYRPVSLLSSLSKLCEKVIFIRLYNFLLEIRFFYKFQSGFRPGDSTINQLIYICHQIYTALENGLEARMVFLDVSKAFDKVWHKGLLYKLECLGVRDPLLSWIRSYLSNRQQRVVIEGQNSEWVNINAGVPQGSVLGPLLFLIFINDITQDLACQSFLYADDTSLLDIVESASDSNHKLNSDLDKISAWSSKWLVTMNASKTRSMTFSAKRVKQVHPQCIMHGELVEEVDVHTHLGLTFASDLSWSNHISNIYLKASKKLNILKSLKFKLNRSTLAIFYKCFVRPNFEYADVIWDNCSEFDSQLLEDLQYDAAKVVTGAMKGTSRSDLLNELAWEDLLSRRRRHKLILFYKIINGFAPSFLLDLLPPLVSTRSRYPLRSADKFSLMPARTNRFSNSFFPSTVKCWNSLDDNLRNIDSFLVFKYQLGKSMFNVIYNKLYDVSFTRYSSILHTRLRLGAHGLNHYLFSINCTDSPMCSCGTSFETVKHFFLFCPNYTALRISLFASAACLLGNIWAEANESQRLSFLTYGPNVNLCSFRIKTQFFRAVQNFIIDTERFKVSC